MASIIKIKRSGLTAAPSALGQGELAYSWFNNTNKLYIGTGTETDGVAANIEVIGGKFFTDMLDHTPGTLTDSSALIVDANSKIDQLNVDNLTIDGNTISATDTNGNIVLDPNGNGSVRVASPTTIALGNSSINVFEVIDSGGIGLFEVRQNGDAIIGGVLTVSGDGNSTFTGSVDIGGSLTVDGDATVNASLSGTDMTLTGNLVVNGNSTLGNETSDTLTLTARVASDIVPSVDSTHDLGTTSLRWAEVWTDKSTAGNIEISGNTIASTNTNGDITLAPNGTGKTIITNLYISELPIQDYIQSEAGNSLVEGEGIDISFNAETGETTVSAEIATSSNRGIASFNTTDFTVADGAVSLNAESIQDIAGAMVSGTGATQNGIIVGYDDTNGKFTFDVNDPTITIDGDVDGSAKMTNLGNTTITVTLDAVLDGSTNKVPGTFGSSSAIPIVTVDAKGRVTAINTASISSSFTIAADTGTPDTFNNGETLTFTGGEGIDTTVTDNTITISAEDASTTNKGVASFSSDNFAVANGVVTIKDGGVANAELANSTVTIGSTTISLGGTSTSIAGMTEVTIGDLNINGSTIANQTVNGSITLAPNGSGTVDVSGKRITSVAEPTQASDAATKQYVDAVSEGLHVHAGVDAATPDTLAALTSGTVTYNNGINGVGATLTLQNALTTLDGYTLVNGDRILVKNEATLAHNGIYVRTSSTVLTRAADYDTDNEIAGGDFVFVVNGTLYNSTGWVQVDPVNVIGTDKIEWIQFSGAGTYLPGNGLSLSGSEFNVNLAETGGLEFSGSNAIQLKSSIAGDGLTITNGVLSVGGTADRITVSEDAVDIASTYAGQSTITTVGTIGSGTWQGTIISPTYGGTGVNNGNKTITLGGNLTTSGAFATILTVTGATNVTLPTTGTLATRTGTESLSNKTITSSSFAGSVAATTLSASGLVTLTNTTDATALGTAAVVLSGGLSVAKQIRAGSNITGNGTTSAIDGFIIDGGTY